MDQGTEPIRQDIDAIRDSMTNKMAQLESKVKNTADDVKRTFDIQQQIADRPWAALGAAVVAGYVLGSLGGDSSQPSHEWNAGSTPAAGVRMDGGDSKQPGMMADVMDQFGEEINTIKGVAVGAVVSLLRDLVTSNVRQFAQDINSGRSQTFTNSDTQTRREPTTTSYRSTTYNEPVSSI